ncbi:hypothetical protein D1007_33644 [Hordeum vulgare]|nr:hypothetical protein D1007_33644 [Hordeum vulgare]
MVPSGKQKRETQGPAPAPPLVECALSKDVDLAPVLPWTTDESSEHGRTLIWTGAIEKRPASKAAFIGVRPSIALFCHFFSLRLHDGAHLSACVSFVAAQSGNLLLMARKKVENFRHRWVLMVLKDANPRLEAPKRLSKKTSAWSSAKLSDPRVVPNPEHFSRDMSAKRLTGEMIVKQFLP